MKSPALFLVPLLSAAGLYEAEGELSYGCTALKFGAAPSCYMQDAEILPSLHLGHRFTASEEYSVAGVAGPAECQAKCADHVECAYFAYHVGTKSCVLKGAPSDATTPEMVVALSVKDVVSGPRDCKQECRESTPLLKGCSGAGPGSCAQLGALFDPSCVESPNAGSDGAPCGAGGYSCCRDYSKASVLTPEKFLRGYILGGRATAAYGNQWFGIESPYHCRALCLRAGKSACTHWNYVTSNTSAFMGGACYLRSFQDAPEFTELKAASADVLSYIGTAFFDKDYGMQHPLETAAEKIKGPPLKSCFSNMKYAGSETLLFHGYFGNNTEFSCQKRCEDYPACRYFASQGGNCDLHSGKYRAEVSSSPSDILGPVVCDGKPTKTSCAVPEVTIEGVDPLPYPPGSYLPALCRQFCAQNDKCVAFVGGTEGNYCRMYSEIPNTLVIDPKRVVGLKNCPGFDMSGSRRRQLEVIPPREVEELLRAQCGREDRLGGNISQAVSSEVGKSLFDCYAECWNAPEKACDRVSYDTREGACHVFGEVAMALEVAPGIVTIDAACPLTLCSHALAAEMPWCIVPPPIAVTSEGVPATANASLIPATPQFADEPAISGNKEKRELAGDIRPPSPATFEAAPFDADSDNNPLPPGSPQLREATTSPPTTPLQETTGQRSSGSVTEVIKEGELGRISQWNFEGEPVDFSSPQAWERIRVTFLSGREGQEGTECPVSDLVSPSCWDQRDSYWPLKMHLQIIVSVTPPGTFHWEGRSWAPMNGFSDTEMEFLNLHLTFDEASHGVQEISPERAGGAWPIDMTSPTAFASDGDFHLRINTTLSPLPYKLALCIDAADYPPSSVCADPIRIT